VGNGGIRRVLLRKRKLQVGEGGETSRGKGKSGKS
jgi:hypothetical protein